MNVKEEIAKIRKRCDELEKACTEEALADFLAEKVMGWHREKDEWRDVWVDNENGYRWACYAWKPEENLDAARQVLDAMWEKGYSYRIDARDEGPVKYFKVIFSKDGLWLKVATKPTEAQAICQAARDALNV